MKKALLIVGALFTGASAYAQEAAADSLFNMLDEITVTSNVIDIAKERETPIAVSTISPAEISLKVGNLEFVEVMNNTPGVYATKQGGGYGDSRLSLRGFDQRNTSFLINGQPVNDMENGWVYWSNWQGLSDVASGIQIQRGLGASRLAVPSVGGTVSIFTKAAELKEGGSFSQSAGNDGYFKTTASYNSGKNDAGWASSVLISRWMGNGYINQTQGEGYNYFAAVGYNPEGSAHSMNASFIGAGQWHHQRDVWVSIRDYQYFTEDNGFKGDGGDINRRWNTNGGTMTDDDGNVEEFSMRRNFYNKPLATFNWDWEISKNIKLATSLYGSAGRGGGTGPRGSYFRNSDMNVLPYRKDLYEHWMEDSTGIASRNADGTIDFDNIVSLNQSTTDPYTGEISDFNGQLIGSNEFRDSNVNRAVMVRRASMNSHNWIGAISNLEITQGKMTYSIGVDLRNYTGYHYRAMNNLMGLDGYYSTGNDNENGRIVNTTIEASPFNNTGIAGPKIDYYNIGKVGWQGLNGMAEYNDNGRLTAVVQAGVSNQSFQRIDYFDQANNPESEVSSLLGGYAKGGANYNIDEQSNVFMNAGYISRQPNFDGVFPGYANDINPDLQNEEIISFELGYGYRTSNMSFNVNAYATNWGNRFISQSFINANGAEGTAQFKNIDVQHNGIEFEGTYLATSDLTIKGMVSLGDWRYTKDFESTLFDDNQNQIGTGVLYVAGARVGDAAQTTAVLNADYKINKTSSVDLNFRYVDGLYADWGVVDSDFKDEGNAGAVKLPAYSLIDLGFTDRFELFGNSASFRFNVNNLLDAVYIAESNTNIHASTDETQNWNGINTANSVWFGFGRTWNASLRYNF
jgi:outer membrane cobalamin receptor